MPDRFYLNPDNVREVRIIHQPPGREHVNVTVVYVTSEVKTLTVRKASLATILQELYAVEGGD